MRALPEQSWTKLGPIFTLHFDDSNVSDYTHAKPLLDELGIPGCSSLMTSHIVDSDALTHATHLTNGMIKNMYLDGWEFVSHTVNHKSAGLSSGIVGAGGCADEAELYSELADSKAAIEAIIQDVDADYTCDMIRYPNHKVDDLGVKNAILAGYKYGGCPQTVLSNKLNPAYFYYRPITEVWAQKFLISTFTSYPAGGIDSVETLLSTFSGVQQETWMAVMVLHRVVDDGATLEVGDITVSTLRAAIDSLRAIGVHFVSNKDFYRLAFQPGYQPVKLKNCNLAVGGDLRYESYTVPGAPPYPWNKSGSYYRFATTGGPLSSDDGLECGYINNAYPTSGYVRYTCPIMVPGRYRVTFQLKRGTSTKGLYTTIWFTTGESGAKQVTPVNYEVTAYGNIPTEWTVKTYEIDAPNGVNAIYITNTPQTAEAVPSETAGHLWSDVVIKRIS